jgi:hypothetical protein
MPRIPHASSAAHVTSVNNVTVFRMAIGAARNSGEDTCFAFPVPIMKKILLALPLLLATQATLAQAPGKYTAIVSGVPWFDDRGREVSAHGANIVRDGDTYYLFGEAHEDGTNAFSGFNCYSSRDLVHGKFERVALPVQKDGALGPQRVGERPKVMKSPRTGEYVMFMHADAMDYRDQYVGYATAASITGPYTFHGPLLFDGKPIRKWDMGTFQDKDGAGYVLLHGGDIYRLADDFRSVAAHVNKAMAHGFESPALFRDGDTYYFLGSHLTGWERNDNYYYSAKSLQGPWEKRGTIAPEGTLAWNSQVTFVLPVEGTQGTTYMFMGDRWSFPRQASAATYVWQPLVVKDGTISLPEYRDAWTIDTKTGLAGAAAISGGTIDDGDARVAYRGDWRRGAKPVTHRVANAKDASFTMKFTGTGASLYGVAAADGGYARVTLADSRGKTVVTSVVDMYSQYTAPALKFASPVLPRDTYAMTVSVLGENWYWVNKKGDRSGSQGVAVAFDKVVVRE